MKKLYFFLIFILISFNLIYSENRVALVIGNGNYSSSPLKNPVNDAKDMASTLKTLNFEVILLTDSTKREILSGFKTFSNKLNSESVGLFYYAGHGTQIDNKNYLIPIGANIETASDVEFEGVVLDRLIRTMEDSKVNKSLIFLDACRDNPYASSSRSGTRGLTVVSTTLSADSAGSLISFATSPGSVAADGDGDNGIFTTALLKYLTEPGLEINQIMVKVRANVMENTNGQQQPWTNVSLTEEFYFSKKIIETVETVEVINTDSPLVVEPVITPNSKINKWYIDTGFVFLYHDSTESGQIAFPGISIGASYTISNFISLGIAGALVNKMFINTGTEMEDEGEEGLYPGGYVTVSIGNVKNGAAINVILGLPIGFGISYKNLFVNFLTLVDYGGSGLQIGYSF
ncbi:MAG: caspase domain-containing protein [Spirochaetaceae bacterium]